MSLHSLVVSNCLNWCSPLQGVVVSQNLLCLTSMKASGIRKCFIARILSKKNIVSLKEKNYYGIEKGLLSLTQPQLSKFVSLGSSPLETSITLDNEVFL